MKLHPFESVRSHRRLLKEVLGPEGNAVQVMGGPLPASEWTRIRVALTVQSSVALECVSRGIPVFLCGWLQDAHSGYLQQFARFGMDEISLQQLEELPGLLERHREKVSPGGNSQKEIAPEVLASLMLGESRTEVVSRS